MATCYCGLVPDNIPDWSPAAVGRRFYRCPRPETDPQRCDFEAWSDPEFTERSMNIIRAALVQLQTLTNELRNRDDQLTNLRLSNEMGLKKTKKKVSLLSISLAVSWVCFVSAGLVVWGAALDK